jgi:hypothetical protein
VHSREELPWDPLEAAATGLAIQAAAAEVVVALRDAGIRSILLKGASFEQWLYEPDEPRIYGDMDLLVSPSDVERCRPVLERLGYRRQHEARAPTHVDHAWVWHRAEDNMHIDLHRSLVGLTVPASEAWAMLSERTESLTLPGTEVEILREPARALQVGLHAMVHGKDAEKTLIDLRRALERCPGSVWREAADLARRLGAETPFATGLRLLPEGRGMAEQLELTTERTVETAMFADSVPYSSWMVNRLANTPGLGTKLRIIARLLAPPPESMRVWYPIARRGPVGLALSYPRRIAWLIRATGPAVAGWWRARRKIADSA